MGCGCGCSGTNPACGVAAKVASAPPFQALMDDQFGGLFNAVFAEYKPAGYAPRFSDVNAPAFGPSTPYRSAGPGTWTVYKPAGLDLHETDHTNDPTTTPPQQAPAMAPAGLTQSQWDSLSPDQKTAYVNADIKTQQDIRNALISGFKTTADLILAGINANSDQQKRDLQLELARIQSAENIERERIRANAQINTPPPTVLQTAPQAETAAGGGGGLVLAVGAAGIAWAMTRKKGKRR
jgi:hypothetical protein